MAPPRSRATLRRNRRPGRAPVVPAREPPRTARGERTRAALVEAARVVFERDGYVNARLTDITDEAGMSSGTFYTYFTGKEDVFAAVLEHVEDEMLHPHVRKATEDEGPAATIRASNRAYLEAYERNAKLMQLLEEVAIYDDEVRELRRRRTAAFGQRNAKAIRDLQLRGIADPSIDPLIAAHALSHMVARTAHAVFVLGEPWDLDDLVDTLTRLWVNALRIDSDDAAAGAFARPVQPS
jgi:AcrR family transcriptional regulator